MQIEVEGVQITLTPEQVNKIEAAKRKPKEERFLELISGLEIKIDPIKYPNSTFFFKGKEVWMELDIKSNTLWIRWSKIWSIFECEYGLKYEEIKEFAKGMVEEHFKMKGVTTVPCRWILRCKVEEHFKMKGVTTLAK